MSYHMHLRGPPLILSEAASLGYNPKVLFGYGYKSERVSHFNGTGKPVRTVPVFATETFLQGD
jgi:hypothetical protein